MRKHVNWVGGSRALLRDTGKRLAVFFAAALLIAAVAACQAPAAPQAAVRLAAGGQAAVCAPLPAEVSVAEAAQKRAAGAFVLDVRTVEEWNEYHVPGSKLIPIDELGARLAEVPKDREVVVVCRSGNRSAKGRDLLLNAGYGQVTSLAGGLQTWRNAGQPVE
jgi:rhodanese-related sulfurtransferase